MIRRPLPIALVLGLALASDATVSAAPVCRAGTPKHYVVHVKGFAYAPTLLRVRAGDSVVFVNDDDEAHTVTATDKSFDSAGLDTGERWAHVFAKAGTFTYLCALHPYMKGTVMVSE